MTELFDAFVIDGVRRTSDGYLAAHAKVARTGIQEYRGSELGRPDLDRVRVYRSPEEVFSADALKSFAHRPVTLKHPSVPVTAKNWKKYAGGHTGDEVVRDGEYVRVPLVMMDQAIIDAYEKDGIKELSMGYSTDIQWRKGVTDAGEEYDAVQTAIRGNHLAVVPVARGGDQLRIGDEEDIEDAWSAEARAAALEARRNGGSRFGGSKEEQEETEKKFGLTERQKLKNALEMYGPQHPKYRALKAKLAKLEDSNINEGDNNMTKLVIDGVPVTVADDQSGAIIERHIAALTKQITTVTDDFEAFKKKKGESDKECADAKALVDTRDGEIVVLKKAVADAAITPEKLDVLVKDRLAVVDKAKSMLDANYVFDGKTVEAIRKDAVTAKLGDAVAKHLNDGAIEGAFTALTVDSKNSTVNATSQIGDALRHRPHSVANLNDAAEKSHDEMTKRLQDAWKTPSAA